MKTIASLFGGGGLVEIGAMAAGYTPIWSVEFDPAIAEVHRANVPGKVLVKRVQDVDPMALDRPDTLHASPVCTRASVANTGAEESEEDLSQADAVCRFLRVLTPPVFTLENVIGYRRFASYQRILCTLDTLGYWTHSEILNSADFGVPQTRKRLILRACREGILAPLPSPVKWVGWYEAIADLIPTLPESKFADWQLKRLPEELMTFAIGSTISAPVSERAERLGTLTNENCSRYRAFLVEGDAAGERTEDVLLPDQTAMTIKTPGGGRVHRAFLVDGKPANFAGELQVAGQAEPVPTLTASQDKHPFRAWLEQGRVVAMTPRALARFQSMPDTYLLPDNRTLAGRVIGNGVPCRMMQAIYEGF